MNLHQYAETHEVTNQPPSLDGTNLYRIDLPLQEWSQRFGAGWAQARIDRYGALAGGGSPGAARPPGAARRAATAASTSAKRHSQPPRGATNSPVMACGPPFRGP